MKPSIDDIARLVREVGGIDDLRPDQDIYDAGFSSVRALDLLLELESRFGVSIPDEGFAAARSAQSLHTLVASLASDGGPGS